MGFISLFRTSDAPNAIIRSASLLAPGACPGWVTQHVGRCAARGPGGLRVALVVKAGRAVVRHVGSEVPFR